MSQGEWHSQVGQRIALEAQRAAVRHLVAMAVRYPDEWAKTRDLAVKWKLLPEYNSHLLRVYERLNRRKYGVSRGSN